MQSVMFYRSHLMFVDSINIILFYLNTNSFYILLISIVYLFYLVFFLRFYFIKN